ncbi:MAG TPA: RNA methyltransferase [Limnochordales bacterium]
MDKAVGRGPALTSTANPRVKAVRALKRAAERRAQGLCLLEGVRLIETALAAGARLQEVFLVPELADSERGRRLVEALVQRGVPVTAVAERVLAHMSDTRTPQGIVAVAHMQEADLRGFAGCSMLVVADGIADPGNLGTLVRTAAATGAALWSRAGSADLYEPKALRASMGALFLVPHRQRMTPEEIAGAAEALGLALMVADARGPVPYTDADWRRPFALVVGSEAHGVSPELREAAAAVVHLPMRPGVESLNAAVTAAVLLFEAVRQRQVGSAGRL